MRGTYNLKEKRKYENLIHEHNKKVFYKCYLKSVG
jgi:hypothetical protein